MLINDDAQLSFCLDLEIDPLWCSWFSGLIDGEGSFIVSVSQNEHWRGCYVALIIEMRDDDAETLIEIQRTLKCGNISYRQRKNRLVKSNGQVTWRVQNHGDTRFILLPLLDRYPLRSRKRYDYILWRDAVLIMGKYKNTESDMRYTELARIRDTLSAIRKYKNDRKH